MNRRKYLLTTYHDSLVLPDITVLSQVDTVGDCTTLSELAITMTTPESVNKKQLDEVIRKLNAFQDIYNSLAELVPITKLGYYGEAICHAEDLLDKFKDIDLRQGDIEKICLFG